MNYSPNVSVIIPCRNEANYIEPCLRSVLEQESPPGGFEVIVADGMSTDNTRDILFGIMERDARVKLIDNPEKITPVALNLAIQSSTGDILIRMDVHTSYAQDYIIQSVRTLKATNADNVGGPWIAKGNKYISKCIAAAFQSPFSSGGAASHNSLYEGYVDTVYLGCWKRSLHEKIGYFDEELVRNQDDEFNLRIIRMGGKVWQSAKIISWYTPRNSLISLFKQYRQYGYWKVRVIQKHKLPASIRHLVPGLFVFTFLVLLVALSGLLVQRIIDTGIHSIIYSTIITNSFEILVLLYSFLLIVASIITSFHSSLKYFPVLPVVFACYHFGYGIGFLEGIIDFFLFKRKSHDSKTSLTR